MSQRSASSKAIQTLPPEYDSGNACARQELRPAAGSDSGGVRFTRERIVDDAATGDGFARDCKERRRAPAVIVAVIATAAVTAALFSFVPPFSDLGQSRSDGAIEGKLSEVASVQDALDKARRDGEEEGKRQAEKQLFKTQEQLAIAQQELDELKMEGQNYPGQEESVDNTPEGGASVPELDSGVDTSIDTEDSG